QGAPAVTIPLQGARIEAQVTEDGCMAGRLGGGITQTDLDSQVIPAIADGVNARIDADGNCRSDINACDDVHSAGPNALDRSATGNGDGQIQPSEITGNSAVGPFLSPDVDLLGANGQAGQDGVKESLSIAIGFECTKAVFTASSEH